MLGLKLNHVSKSGHRGQQITACDLFSTGPFHSGQLSIMDFNDKNDGKFLVWNLWLNYIFLHYTSIREDTSGWGQYDLIRTEKKIVFLISWSNMYSFCYIRSYVFQIMWSWTLKTQSCGMQHIISVYPTAVITKSPPDPLLKPLNCISKSV